MRPSVGEMGGAVEGKEARDSCSMITWWRLRGFELSYGGRGGTMSATRQPLMAEFNTAYSTGRRAPRTSCRHRRSWGAFVGLWLAVALPPAGFAHGNAHEQIQALSIEISKSPTNAMLFFQRGELLLQHGEWLPALADFETTRHLSPALPGLQLARARALTGARRLDEAGALLDQLVAASPTNATVLLDRAHVLGLRGRTAEAVADFAKAIPLVIAPDVGLFLEPAHLLAKAGKLDDALAWLDRGLTALGPNPELALPAIELLLQQNRFADALVRADAMLGHTRRAAAWLALRGDILQQAGRREEAGRAFRESLTALENLPPTLRRTQANAELERQVRDALDRLQTAARP